MFLQNSIRVTDIDMVSSDPIFKSVRVLENSNLHTLVSCDVSILFSRLSSFSKAYSLSDRIYSSKSHIMAL